MTRNPRPGVTLLELVVVLALLLILAAVIVPSFSGMQGNSKQRTAADAVKARLADARARAIETGQAYRVAVSSDGTRIRMGPDTANFSDQAADNPPQFLSKSAENTLDTATVEVTTEEGNVPPAVDSGGWITVATFKPDGTCREDRALVLVKQVVFPPIPIQVRGIVGIARTLPAQQVKQQGTP